MVRVNTKSDSESDQYTVLVGGTLIDGRGGAPLADSAIVIQGQRIAEIRSANGFEFGEAARVIDVTGKYVLPGLIDIHIHYADWMGQLFLSHGVTTVKDLGNDVAWISTICNDIDRGKVRGPRILYVGNGLDAPPPDRNNHPSSATSRRRRCKRAPRARAREPRAQCVQGHRHGCDWYKNPPVVRGPAFLLECARAAACRRRRCRERAGS